MDRSNIPKKLVGHSGDVSSIAVPARGGIFATGAIRHQSVEGLIKLWSLSTGELVGGIGTDLNAIYSLAISPDCRLLAAGGGAVVSGLQWVYTGGVEVWDLDDKQRSAKFGEELLFIKSIAFSPDGGMLLTSNLRTPRQKPAVDKRRLRLWRASDFRNIAAFGEHEIGISAACFSPDGEFVAFGSNPLSVGVRLNSSSPQRFSRWHAFSQLLRRLTFTFTTRLRRYPAYVSGTGLVSTRSQRCI
ncbi:MAG: WD40 repeat domain-containing protein [Candidatus Sulfotelmatobacter sp.]